jgi:hypothetical protein
MWGPVKPNSKEVLKHDGFIRLRHKHKLRAESTAIFLGKIVIVVSMHREAGFVIVGCPKS